MTSTLSVLDVVVHLPKTLGVTVTVKDARAALTDDHVHMLLLTEGGRLVGTLVREDLPEGADESLPAVGHATLRDRTIEPHLSAEAARSLMVTRGIRRLAVTDRDGALLGLLCLKRRRTGFCTDEDVRARAEDPRSGVGDHEAAGGEVLRNR